MSLKELFERGANNITDKPCPNCQKKLRIKPPCCSDKKAYYTCPCGYKAVIEENK